MPYVAMQQMLDPLWQAGAHNYFTSAMIDDLPDEAVDELIAGGRPSRRHRARSTSTTPAARWRACPRRDGVRAPHLAVHPQRHRPLGRRRGLRRATRPGPATPRPRWPAYGPDAMYVNFTGDAGEDKVRASYPPETYARARRGQDALRPDERVPAEPEHPAAVLPDGREGN